MVTKYNDGTYNFDPKGNGRQFEVGTFDLCAKMLVRLMEKSEQGFARVYEGSFELWEFRLMKGNIVDFDIDIDPTCSLDDISEHLRLLLEMTVKEDPVSFYDPTDVGNELMD